MLFLLFALEWHEERTSENKWVSFTGDNSLHISENFSSFFFSAQIQNSHIFIEDGKTDHNDWDDIETWEFLKVCFKFFDVSITISKPFMKCSRLGFISTLWTSPSGKIVILLIGCLDRTHFTALLIDESQGHSVVLCEVHQLTLLFAAWMNVDKKPSTVWTVGKVNWMLIGKGIGIQFIYM